MKVENGSRLMQRKSISRNRHRVIIVMKLAYFNAKEDLAIRKYEGLCGLAYSLNVEEMPIQHDYSSYTNMMAGKEFIFCISEYLDDLQKQKLLQSPYYALMVDETTNRSLEKHLIMCFSFLAPKGTSCSSAEIKFAKLLTVPDGCVTVPDGCAQTKFDAIMKMMKEVGLNKQQLVGIATDTDSSMLGCHDGLVAKMKREMPHLMSVHCIAHREALVVLDTVKCFPCFPYIDKNANKVYSWISGSSVRHTGFQSLLKEMHLQVLEVLNIHEVQWLARGNVMERLMQLMPAILSFWKDKAKGWYDKLWVYKVLFCIYMLADVLRDLNVLNTHFQKENVDIPSISVEIKVIVASLKRKFLEQEFGKGTHFLKKFMDATKDRVFVYVSDDGEEISHQLLYAKIPGNDANGLPLDREEGDVQSCINFAKGFVLKVIECVNDRFPYVYFFNAAKLFSPHYYSCRTKIAEEIKAREKKFSEWLEKLLEKFGVLSAAKNVNLMMEGIAAGALEFLEKPLTKDNAKNLWQEFDLLPDKKAGASNNAMKDFMVKSHGPSTPQLEQAETRAIIVSGDESPHSQELTGLNVGLEDVNSSDDCSSFVRVKSEAEDMDEIF
ncbi:hypothetical protein L7F22_033042 [Adiantum nelumboides]|nr:hypothetical protein [Adiantum nelumboides]